MSGRAFLRTLKTATVVLLILVFTPHVWAASKFKTLYAFTGSVDGSEPWSGVISDKAGNLYGTTYFGGAYDNGEVFELSRNSDGSWSEKVLHSFCGDSGDGCRPAGSLIFDRSGNLYGTTFTGGTDGAGIVFELVPQPDGTWTEGVLHSFTGSDGGAPTAALIFDNSGNLYGTASEGGGTHADGVVFELSPQGNGTWMLDVLHVFLANGSDGFSPGGELLFDSAGNLYGTTSSGGAYDEGTVFELTPNGKKWTETILHSFKQDGIDGRGPNSALITDSAGNLYGTTVYGGVDDQGVVFQLQPGGGGSWNEVVLHSFKLRDGMQPYAGLILDRAGNLYGTTWRGGGGGKGTVFKLKPTGTGRWTETVLHSFRNHPGSYPRGGVIRDAHGNVYGASHGDNKKTFGSVFKITP